MFRPTHIALCVLLSAVAALAVDPALQDAPTESNQPVAIPDIAVPASAPDPAPVSKPVTQPPSAVRDPTPAEPAAAATPKPRPAAETPAPLLIPEPVAPQESLPLVSSANENQPVHTAAVSPGSDRWLLQTFLALGIVIGLIFALRYIVQRLGGAATSAAHVAPLVEVLARTSIAPKTQMMFLKINQRLIVVAQSPAGLQPITTFDDPEDIAWALTQIESAKPMSITQGFRQIMHRFDGDYDPETLDAETSGGDERHIDRTHNQMSSLLSRIRNLSRKQ